jgi:adenylate cyclase
MTYHLCQDKVWVRQLDRVRVKGKNQAVSIYELIGSRSVSLDAQAKEFLDCFNQGRITYLAKEFKQAIRIFEEAKKMRPDDRAVQIHLARSLQYLQTAVPEEWDGVYTMTTK